MDVSGGDHRGLELGCGVIRDVVEDPPLLSLQDPPLPSPRPGALASGGPGRDNGHHSILSADLKNVNAI
jgi:hypothetical protein